ncbi:hypothetical protein K435DRAFT_778664 [Dendrothele bispora CBS 962.96]|uniref:G-protein coupled receptors family 1 profile domain-containing protein n=1 Tax=Dendrothele bispora (strain CBS 962.96) TaxID=1314807 RepID=A0A4S8M3D6_DENBC|nr:hypothetical protein K435DRAFT_778664 [Dendrothele bispora CBS 962.96]
MSADSISQNFSTNVSTSSVAFILAAEYLLYGIHAVLFCLCAFYVPGQRKAQGRNDSCVHLTANTILFVLGTVGLIVDSVAVGLVFTSLPQSAHRVNILESINVGVLVFAGFASESLLIYRLWCIWNRQLKIVIIPIIILCGADLMGILGAFLHNRGFNFLSASRHERLVEAVALLVVALASLLVSTLIAARIWWIWQAEKNVTGNTMQTHYRKVIMIVLETGLVTPIFTLLASISIFLNWPINSECLLIQTAGIGPAMITVRATMGLSIDDIVQNPRLNSSENAEVELDSIMIRSLSWSSTAPSVYSGQPESNFINVSAS